MILSFVAQNLALGGVRDSDGAAEDRWPALAKRISTVSPIPDFVLLTETTEWQFRDHRQLSRAMNDLDMDACPLPPSKSGHGTALLYRREQVGRWLGWDITFSRETLHGFGVATFDVGLPAPLSVAAAHLDPFTPDKAAQEAELICTRGYRHGPYAVIGGDINYAPLEGPEPNYAEMRPYNLAARTLIEIGPDGQRHRVPNRIVAQKLDDCSYVDVALRLYEQTQDESLLHRTSYGDRVDQFHVSSPLGNAITSYQRLPIPEGASDHDGIAMTIDTELIDVSDPWSYR